MTPISFELVPFDPVVNDIEVASETFTDFLRLKSSVLTSDGQDVVDIYPCIGVLGMPALCRLVRIGDDLTPASVYDQLIHLWVSSLPPDTSSTARHFLESRARSITAQLCLASYQYLFDDAHFGGGPNLAEPAGHSAFALPLRRKSSATGLLQEGEDKAAVMLAEGKMSNDSDHVILDQMPRPTLPTPEPTPSVHSPSLSFSITETESAASQRLRSVTQMLPQSSPADSTSKILDHWTLGMNPWGYLWVKTQQNIEARNETGKTSQGKLEASPRKRPKRDQVGVAPRPVADRITGSQPQSALNSESQRGSLSSQPLVMSQVEPGLYGSRIKTPARQKRRAGF